MSFEIGSSKISICPFWFFFLSVFLRNRCVLVTSERAALLSLFALRVDFLDCPIATARLAWKSLVLRVFWGTLLIGSGGLSLIHTAANINHASSARPYGGTAFSRAYAARVAARLRHVASCANLLDLGEASVLPIASAKREIRRGPRPERLGAALHQI